MFSSFFTTLARLFRPAARRGLDVGTAAAAMPPPQLAQPDLAPVQELIGKVTAMTSAVAQDVGSHNANLQAISTELAAVAQSDPAAVAAIVCKLLVANGELQGRLQSAEASLKLHSQQLEAAVTSARTDSLTGLMNRRALDEELRRCLSDFQQNGRPAALLMLDVDLFKTFNDTFGHVAGDHVLAYTARLLHTEAAPGDIVARFGGEEFAILFKGASAADVRQRAERLRQSIGKRMVGFGGQQLHVTASAGLAELTSRAGIADWIMQADRALYAAKSAGRDCAFEVRGETLERIELTAVQPPQKPETPTLSQPKQEPDLRAAAEPSVELAAEAFLDTTFVPNIARRIAEWRRGGSTLTVVLARLDDPVHDAEHEADDLSPTRVALQAARVCVRDMDVVTRWQSDGIAFLLPNTSVADAKTVARRLRATLAANHTGGGPPRLSISIGMAEGIEGNDAKRVLERAWLALAAARTAGAGNIYFHDGLKSVAVKLAPVPR